MSKFSSDPVDSASEIKELVDRCFCRGPFPCVLNTVTKPKNILGYTLSCKGSVIIEGSRTKL